MAFFDTAVNNAKLKLTSEPWSPEDKSFKNRAELGVYTDDLGCGFSVFLRHPEEQSKTYTKRSGEQAPLSNLPLSARFDPIGFKMVCDSIRKLVSDTSYPGRTFALKGTWYDDKGEIYRPEGVKGFPHVSSVMTGRADDGSILIAVREMKHPLRDWERPGAKFVFGSNMWLEVQDNDTGAALSKVEDSKDTALAFVSVWEDMVAQALFSNYETGKGERADRKAKYAAKRNAANNNNGGGTGGW